MAKPHGVDASGRPVNLIGQPMAVRPAPDPKLRITRTEERPMAKAEKAGVYVLNGVRYRINAGDVLPEGAEMDAPVEERAKDAAPENRAEKAAPQNRAAKKAE